MARTDRRVDEIREIKIEKDYIQNADGSVLISCGNTKLIATAMIENKVPPFLKGKNTGWLSCEYAMLPASTQTRKIRDSSKGRVDGRSQEIQRLIGRSLRACIDLDKIGERTIWIDIDVVNADGGTRTTAINGGYIALVLAIRKLMNNGVLKENPILKKVGAISLGIVDSELLLDLKYTEDSRADVDMNVVMDSDYKIIEIQSTAERESFTREELNILLDLSEQALSEIFEIQDEALKENKKIVLSSDNVHKIEEFQEILSDLDIDVLSKKEVGQSRLSVDEIYPTLEGNAHLKASALKKKCKYAVISDDTGLFINALGDEPGVRSARYAGEHDDSANRKKVLEKLKGIEDRRAYFKTVIVYISEDGQERIFEGICKGEIAKEERGDKSFGYDCIFVPQGFEKTFGEMSSDEKNTISHRSRAIKKFKDFLIQEESI